MNNMCRKMKRFLPNTYTLNTISSRHASLSTAATLKYTSLTEMKKPEFDTMCEQYNIGVMQQVPNTLLNLLRSQHGDTTNDKKFGMTLDLYEHQLQCATRAYKDGASEEIVVMALFHDAAVNIAPHNHGPAIASFFYPYVSPKGFWILSHHDIFQSYYYLHHCGRESDEYLSKYKDHPYYDDTVNFCYNYDQSSFDTNYESYSLEFFEKMVDTFFKQEPFWWNDGVEPRCGGPKLM